FDSNPHPMWVYDAETLAILAVNEAAVAHYGWSAEEFRRMRFDQLGPSADGAGNAAGLAVHHRKDRSDIEVEVASRRIPFGGRDARLVLAVDVTEKRSLAAQLLQAQKIESVGRLAGGIAHDFNNILGVITGYAELLRRRLPGEPPEWRKYVDDILKAAARAGGLTRQLLAFSRSQVLQP